MNYKFETIMTWITYVRTGVWEIDKNDELVNDPDLVKNKFEELFKNELVRETNDARHFMAGPYRFIGTISVFVDLKKKTFKVMDNYNLLLAVSNGIYKTFDGKKLCLDTEAKGFKVDYFKFCYENGDPRYVSIESIVKGTCKDSHNVRRMISLLFGRNFQYMETCEPEQFMLMDYPDEKKEEMVSMCKKFYEKPVRIRQTYKEEDEDKK